MVNLIIAITVGGVIGCMIGYVVAQAMTREWKRKEVKKYGKEERA